MHPEAGLMLENAVRAGALWGIAIAEPPSPERALADGDIVEVGDLSLEVLYTPGHAPGHVSFYLSAHQVVFDGDVLFAQSIGRTDFPGSDHETLLQSIRRRLLVLPDDTTVLSGHGPATTIGREKQTNPFLQETR
jgi:glyoxylase-like metal-dependent hydrolase (beta-lactamase superfamily II)